MSNNNKFTKFNPNNINQFNNNMIKYQDYHYMNMNSQINNNNLNSFTN